MAVNEEEISRLFSFESIKDVPIGIIANKQDVDGALSSGEVAAQLRLMDLGLGRPIQVFAASMLTGEGIDAILKWMEVIATEK